MRAFVAIFPPPGIQDVLHRAALALPIEKSVRCVPPENIHLTIKFLGDVPPERLTETGKLLAAVRERHGTFEVELSGFGAFPSERRGRVLWAGAGGGSELLGAIAADVEDALEPLGFEREPRAYRPHLTLGRARGRPFVLGGSDALNGLTFQAERLTLVRSVLRRDGALYETVGVYPLTGSTADTAGLESDQRSDRHEDEE